MVMEAPPSPDSVGREFVRQYYTLLNKAPAHLHRFYNNQSSFVHGGLDPPNRETSPMIGQKQIHQKIQQLNFRDCHAKIAQVDAQATLGNGVVVQVTGELSNAGQPMRRFTQTFVLAAQSPKKYYVHNDIFRYQDEIISDEECEPEVRSDVEDEINQEHPSLGDMQPINQQPMPHYTPSAAPLQATIPTVPLHHVQPPPHIMPPQPQPAPVPTVNGTIITDEWNVMSDEWNVITEPQVPHVSSAQAPILGAPLSGLQPATSQPPITMPMPVEERPQSVDEESGDGQVEPIYSEEPMPEVDAQELIQEPATNEPKTYATLLKSGNNVGYGTVTQITSLPPPPPKSVSPPPAQMRYDSRDMQSGQQFNQGPPLGQRSNLNRNNNTRGNQQRVPRQDSRGGGPGRTSINEDGNSFEERRRSQGNSFSDMNQLFLGNLPHNATEDDLRDIFIQFGSIVDLRIHSKPGNKAGPPGTRVPPNYGFITYETQQGVQNCLVAKPIYFPQNDKNGVQLNVEEKKIKDRPFGSGRPSGDNNGGQRPRDNGGVRRGPGGPNINRGGGGGGGGPPGGPGNRPNSFNRGPPRGPNNTYNNRR